MSDMDRPMPEELEGQLKTALKLRPNENLPDDVIKLFWEVERTCRRIGHHITGSDLVWIAINSGRPTPENPVSFIDEVLAGKVGIDDIVLAKFRNKWEWGRYQGYDDSDKRILVQLDDGTAEVRKFKPTGVRFPIKEEMDAINAYAE